MQGAERPKKQEREQQTMNAKRIKNRFWDNHAEIKQCKSSASYRDCLPLFDPQSEVRDAEMAQYYYAKRVLAKATDEQLVEIFGVKWVGFVKRWVNAEIVTSPSGTTYVKLANA